MTLLMALLPTALQIFGLILKSAGAHQDTLAAFQKLVEASKNDGLITVQTKDVFAEQKVQMEAAFKKDALKPQSPAVSPPA